MNFLDAHFHLRYSGCALFNPANRAIVHENFIKPTEVFCVIALCNLACGCKRFGHAASILEVIKHVKILSQHTELCLLHDACSSQNRN
jgi:hypothetical protein